MIDFKLTVSALCDSFIYLHDSGDRKQVNMKQNQVVEFVMAQRQNMPDYLKLPLVILTAIFDLWSIIRRGKRFHQLPLSICTQQITAWKMSPVKICRDLIRFYESLTIFSYYSNKEELT